MVKVDYKITMKDEPPFNYSNINFKQPFSRRISKKGGSDPNKFLKDVLEIADVFSLPFGLLEEVSGFMLRKHYSTKGEFGWSENMVREFLLKMKRKPDYIEQIILYNKKRVEVNE